MNIIRFQYFIRISCHKLIFFLEDVNFVSYDNQFSYLYKKYIRSYELSLITFLIYLYHFVETKIILPKINEIYYKIKLQFKYLLKMSLN